MSDPASRLPARPSLVQLRKQAKELLHRYRAGDPDAVQRFRSTLPRLAAGDSGGDAVLGDAQFVLARSYGFQSWAALARHVETINPSSAGPTTARPIRPIELDDSRSIQLPAGGVAPAEAVWSIFVASRGGDLDRMKELVARHPGLATVEYNYTPPIHFAVREGHVELVRYLLEQGADPTYRTYPFHDSLLTMAEDREHHEVARLLRTHLSRRFAVAEGTSAILDAAGKGDLARVEAELARDGTLARASNETGDTALHQAAGGGHLAVVEALLAAGAQVDAIRSDGYRPVHCASMPSWRARVPPEHARAIADTLIAHGAQYTILLAALRGDSEFVRSALRRDSSLANFEDTCHRRPISAAAGRKDLEMVKLLLSHGADPNLPEHGAPRGSALWDAVYHRQTEMARLLLEHGADPNAMVESSGTPMGHARKDPELFRLLQTYGGDERPGDSDRLERLISDGDLPGVERMLEEHPDLTRNDRAFWSEGILAGPANGANREMLALLIRYGARVPTVTKWAPYYYFKHHDIAAFLLDRGMDPNHMNWHRFTLLHHMAAEGDVAKAGLLLDHGAALEAIDEEYRSTPLGIAARWGRREMISLLLERGADPNASGAAWATPLAWARKKGHVEIEADLRRAGAV